MPSSASFSLRTARFSLRTARSGRAPARATLARSVAFAGLLITATPAHAVDDKCIFLSSISGWNAINDNALIVYTGPRKAYRVDVDGYCYGLRYTETLAVDSRDGRLCWASNNHILTSDGGRCLVTSVLPMADEKPKNKAR